MILQGGVKRLDSREMPGKDWPYSARLRGREEKVMFRRLFSLVITLGVIAAGGLWYIAETEGDGDMCVARAELIASQIPPALDKLSAKHPLSVGLIRNVLNQDGVLDDLIMDIVADIISEEDMDEEVSQVECAMDYVRIYFNREGLQDEIVATLEAELGLES